MEQNEGSSLAQLTDAIGTAITGIPAPLKKNFFKVLGQLCTDWLGVHKVVIQGKIAEIRAASEARVKILQKEGQVMADNVEVPQAYIERAASKFASKIVREQINLDQIALNAAQNLKEQAVNQNAPESQDVNASTSDREVDDDWLNEFENIARAKSSDEMKIIFGKILSGEVTQPGSFAIKTLRIVSQLDQNTAKLFQTFCAIAISQKIGTFTRDVRVVSLTGQAGSNSLQDYGLSFDNLNILHEHGLIIADYNSYMPYQFSIMPQDGDIRPIIPMIFQKHSYLLLPKVPNYDKELKIHGVALTKAGQELFGVTEIGASEKYSEDLVQYFASKQFDMVRISASPLPKD